MTATVTPPSRSLWRRRNLRIAWCAGFVNDTGDWVLNVALPVVVFVETGSGAATAALFLCQLAPAVALSPVAGTLVDRLDLRRALIVTNVVQAGALLPLLAVSGDRVWPAYVVVAAQSALNQVNNPANVSIVTRLVTTDELPRANSALAASASLARLLGAPLGGALVAWHGLAPIIVVDIASFTLVAMAVSFIDADTAPRPDPGHQPGRSDLRAGIRIVRANHPLGTLLTLHGISQIAQGAFVIVFVAFVVDTLDDDGSAVGIIRGTMAVGALIGSIVVSRASSRVSSTRLYGLGLIGMGAVSLLFWNLPTVTTAIWAYALVFSLSGLPGAALSVGLFTTLQTSSPAHALGRTTALLNAAEAVGIAAGAIAAGMLIDHLPLRPILDTQAVVYLLTGTIAIVTLSARRRPAPGTASSAPRRRPRRRPRRP